VLQAFDNPFTNSHLQLLVDLPAFQFSFQHDTFFAHGGQFTFGQDMADKAVVAGLFYFNITTVRL